MGRGLQINQEGCKRMQIQQGKVEAERMQILLEVVPGTANAVSGGRSMGLETAGSAGQTAR